VKGKIGCPTRIVTPVPYTREMFRGAAKELSKDAKFRLKVPGRYFKHSARFSPAGKPSVSITCRRFGIHRSCFYRRENRYNKSRLSSLENKSAAPCKRRMPSYPGELVNRVREIRKADPTYSGKKMNHLAACREVSCRR
jgi:hypothetical protein